MSTTIWVATFNFSVTSVSLLSVALEFSTSGQHKKFLVVSKTKSINIEYCCSLPQNFSDFIVSRGALMCSCSSKKNNHPELLPVGNANLKTIRKSSINQQWTKDISGVLMKPTLTQRSSQGIVFLLSSYCKLQQTGRPASQVNHNLFLSWGSKCQADRLLSDKKQAQSLCQVAGWGGIGEGLMWKLRVNLISVQLLSP